MIIKAIEIDKPIDPLPEQFATIEEAAEFWDTHDLPIIGT
jgi:hypothetical protein